MTDRTTQLENLSPAKRALLVKLLREDASRGSEQETIEPRPNKALAPLSFAQQRLWILDQLQPGNPFYNIPVAVRLSGPLDRPVLEASLQEIVRRHEALRTTFSMMDERPMQRIAASLSIHLSVDDLSALPVETREAAARRRATEEAQLPFDLARGPLARLTLLRLGEEEHVLLLTLHHIVSDGWSMGLLVQELATLYEAFTRGKPSPLLDLSIQYADFAHWQRGWLEGEVLQKQLSYWRDRLSDLPALELPTDRSRPSVQTFRGASNAFTLSEPLSESLRALSRREGATLFMTLLASFQTLLSRYSGQRDVVVGSPIAGRNRSEIEGLIGFFVNMLVMRADLSGDPSFRELLHTVIEVAVGAYANQDLPFEKLVEELQPERSLSQEPLFQVAFAMQNFPMPAVELPVGLRITPFESDFGIAKFDLMLFMWEGPGALSGHVEYSTDLFEVETIERMVEHFQTLLEGIVANPDRRLSEMPLMSEDERHELLVRWNDTATDYSGGRVLHELFENQVERSPDLAAVVFEGQHWTYRELNQRANQLAHHLQSLGVGTEKPVGILMERSSEMIVSLLAILKAGGAYVPLDPDYPDERLYMMMEDAQISEVLVQDGQKARLPSTTARIICVNGDSKSIACQPIENLSVKVLPENLAYVIFTSGSTGRPKGVMNTHGGICNRLHWGQDEYQLEQADRVLQKTPFSFDVSVWEFFWPLTTGARLVLAKPGGHRDPTYLAELIEEQQITTAHFVPSMLHAFLEETGLQRCAGLERVICSGEAMSYELQQKFFDRLERCDLLNHYGPTEAAVEVTYWACCASERPIVPIGRPIGNLRIYILDGHFDPVPIGVPGELHIAGAGLARGYYRRPELTTEKFIADPFSNKPGARMYCTGDLARYLPDGNIEFLGRVDRQVKIRGNRIELSEIESALREHPAVRQAVVVARNEPDSGNRLVAYLVRSKEQEAPLADVELRRHLQATLPDYMVPSAFVTLPSLPLSASGKVDWNALPAPEGSRPRLEAAYVGPRTPAEKALARVWSEVLRVERVGVHDNFFELGGDSILAIQAIFKARQAGFQFTPIQLYQHQTIFGLADVSGTAVPIHAEQGPVEGPVFLTPIQHWFLEQDLLDKHHFNMAVMFKGDLFPSPESMETVITTILEHHDALRLRLEMTPDGWLMKIEPPDESAARSIWVRENLAEVAETERTPAIEKVAAKVQESLNLADGPLIRIVHFDLGSDEPARLLMVVHHLAIDGISWRILMEDLLTVYRQLSDGTPVALFPKTTSFKHWAEGLAEHAQSEAVRQELAYWREVCAEADSTLPVDFEERPNVAASTDHVSVSLSEEETGALLQDVPAVYNTQINDLLLTALVEAVTGWTGRSSVFLTLEGHGREVLSDGIDLSRTVGWFTSLFPIRLQLSEERSVGASIKSIKEQLRSIPNRGAGYGLLRYLCNDETIREELRSFAEPKLSFNYLGQFDQLRLDESLIPVELARESTGPIIGPRETRRHLVDVGGAVAGGRLSFDWVYSRNRHDPKTIQRVAQRFITALQEIIRHCQTPEAGARTPSDFPLAELSEEQLESVLDQVDFE